VSKIDTATQIKPKSALITYLTDWGPLIVYLLAYWRTDIFTATIAFMVAITIAIGVSWIVLRHVSPLLLFSAFMVLVLGGLTVWLHDETFIKLKPTIYYLIAGITLVIGLVFGRPLLKLLLGNAYPELDDNGWRLLSRNFALFFFAMAVINELVWRNSSTAFWLGFKLWGSVPLTLIFGLANVPMIMRHSRPAADAEPPVAPQG